MALGGTLGFPWLFIWIKGITRFILMNCASWIRNVLLLFAFCPFWNEPQKMGPWFLRVQKKYVDTQKPLKTNMDTQNDGPWKMHLLLTMAIFFTCSLPQVFHPVSSPWMCQPLFGWVEGDVMSPIASLASPCQSCEWCSGQGKGLGNGKLKEISPNSSSRMYSQNKIVHHRCPCKD